jgi:hypothetical protein
MFGRKSPINKKSLKILLPTGEAGGASIPPADKSKATKQNRFFLLPCGERP